MKRLLAGVVLCFVSPIALADHGPGGTGGGVGTLSAETLEKGTLTLTLGAAASTFQDVDDPEGIEMASRSGHHHVDVLDRSLLGELRLAYGVTDVLELSLSTGYYSATGARIYDPAEEHHEEEGEGDEHSGALLRPRHAQDGQGREHDEGDNPAAFDPDGPTDLWLHAKYRFHVGTGASTALVGGLKAPTGDDAARDSNGEPVEPASTASSGAWDVMAGIAHSRRLSSRVDLDASLAYTAHQEREDYRIGDRADGGVALSLRVSPKHTPIWRLVMELDGRWRDRNEEGGADNENSGGVGLFAAAGASVVFTDHVGVSIMGVAPVSESTSGEQIETSFALQGRLTLTF